MQNYKKGSPYNYHYYYFPQTSEPRDRMAELKSDLRALEASDPRPFDLDFKLGELAQRYGIKKIRLAQMFRSGWHHPEPTPEPEAINQLKIFNHFEGN